MLVAAHLYVYTYTFHPLSYDIRDKVEHDTIILLIGVAVMKHEHRVGCVDNVVHVRTSANVAQMHACLHMERVCHTRARTPSNHRSSPLQLQPTPHYGRRP